MEKFVFLVVLVLSCKAAVETVETAEDYDDSDYEVELGLGDFIVVGRIGKTDTEEEVIRMTLGELQEIFGVSEVEEEKLTKGQKKKARKCRREKTLFSRTDGKCHQPTATEPCSGGKWFVAEKGRLDGVCVINPCPGVDSPILFKGSCTPVYGSCDSSARLYINKRGQGFCECDEGFSYNRDDGGCYREHTRGPCSDSKTWKRKSNVPRRQRKGHKRFGKCRKSKCQAGEVKWTGGVCLLPDTGAEYDSCVKSTTGKMEARSGKLTCRDSPSTDTTRASPRAVRKLFFDGE